MFNINNQQGVSLFLVILVTSVVLAISFGINAILVKQIKMVREIGYSVTAFYAADSGIERQLYDLYKSSSHQPSYSINCGLAHFETKVSCGKNVPAEDCPTGFDIDPNCSALNYCIKSIGNYEEVKRAIEIKY